MNRRLPTIFFLSFITTSLAFSQNFSQIGVQYFEKPFLVNPSLIGSFNEGTSVHYSLYKTSWGVANAPSIGNLSLIIPYNDKLTLGVNYLSEKGGIFNISRILGTFAYRLDLSEDTHILVGLAAGVYGDKIDTSSLNATTVSTDNTLLTYNGLAKPIIDADIGVQYMSPSLEIGIAFVNLKKYLSNKLLPNQLGLGNVSVYYHRDLGTQFRLSGILQSRLMTDGFTSGSFKFQNMQIDVGARMEFDQKFSATLLYKAFSSSLVSGFAVRKNNFGIFGGYHLWFGDFGNYFGGSLELAVYFTVFSRSRDNNDYEEGEE